MNLSHFLNFLSFRLTDDKNNLKAKIIILNLLVLLSLSLLLVSGLKLLTENILLESALVFACLIVLSFFFILFPGQKYYKLTSTGVILLIILSLGIFHYLVPVVNNSYYLVLVMPFFIVFLLPPATAMAMAAINLILYLPSILNTALSPHELNHNAFLVISIVFISEYFAFSFLFDYLQKKLDSVNKELEKSIKEANEKNEFISGLSHQLRTSLNNILLVNNLVNASKLDTRQKDLIDTLQASTNNLVDTVNKIVDVSQPGLYSMKETKVSFDLVSTLESTIKIFRNKDNLDLKLSISKNIGNYIIGDPIKLKQIILNILQSIIQPEKLFTQLINISVIPEKEGRNDISILFIVETCLSRSPKGKADFNNCHKNIEF